MARFAFLGLLFFAFFINFAVFNITSIDWGLQVSWVFAMVFIFCYSIVIIWKSRWNFRITKQAIQVCIFFLVLCLITFLDWVLLGEGIMNIPKDAQIARRSFFHFIYVLFDFIVFCFLYIYLDHQEEHDTAVKFFVLYPFFFIVFWGIYQVITTFNLLPYFFLFNNNLSTGFTYDRFKPDHRSSSIFPEPSEYAYYLAFMAPILWAYFRKKLCFFKNYRFRLLLLIMLASQIVLAKSMSLVVVFPVLVLLIMRDIEDYQFRIKHYLLGGIGLVLVVGIVAFVFRERLTMIVSGRDPSALVRLMAFFGSYRYFLLSPVTGIGFGGLRGLDLLGFLLANLGIIGLFFFILFIFKIKNTATKMQKVLYCSLKCTLITAAISNPVLEHIFFWVILAFLCANLRLPSIEKTA